MAREAREYARAPYSSFKVGAAVECVDGRTFTGCNIENSSYGSTLCAEQVALAKAVSEGARGVYPYRGDRRYGSTLFRHAARAVR